MPKKIPHVREKILQSAELLFNSHSFIFSLGKIYISFASIICRNNIA
jgi:hypothetical protein